MTVSHHVPWPVRIALPAVLLLLAMATGALAMRWRMLDALSDARTLSVERDAERERARVAEAERDRLAAIANAAGGELTVERTAAERLGAQVADLERENARLQADLAYLERLLPAAAGEGDLAIRGLRVELEPAAEGGTRRLRYRALLTQPGKVDRDFTGTLQLGVTTVANGRVANLTWPPPGDAQARELATVAFRRFRRIEGLVDLPGDVTIRQVQMRVLAAGSVRAQMTASP